MSNEYNNYTIEVKEAAQILNISKRSVTRKINKGELDAVKKKGPDGRKRWYLNEDQEELNAPQVIEDVVDVAEVEKSIALSEFKQDFKEMIKNEINPVLEENQKLKEAFKHLIEQNQTQTELINKLEEEIKDAKNEIASNENRITQQTGEQIKTAALLLFEEQKKENQNLKEEINSIKKDLQDHQEKRDKKLMQTIRLTQLKNQKESKSLIKKFLNLFK